MNSETELDSAVESILSTARERSVESADGAPVSVDARSLPDAIERANADGRVPVIAEVKPTSPTADGTRSDDPVELAQKMVAGGATAISVLTEPTHFGGSADALTRVREAVDVPVLRKDFVLDVEGMDLVEADLLLLIVRFVDDLESLVDAARERGFQPLVEVHDRAELETALEAGAKIIGVNNRDLARLDVDLGTFESVAPAVSELTGSGTATDGEAGVGAVPEGITLIAESGISGPADVTRMREAGADALLVGSAIMDHAEGETDVSENTRRLTRADDVGSDTSGSNT
ncbi:indole-3-glycerol-phosphate synthase [Natrarchaeobius halalkaliphilus]|uniref:Indole-3-glycerol phosphate synthase n=1 Tax=Natrarchaeobius halalkaliphilus TaxID=1679091 RepID=A0A3N6LMF8_9EURY|nr:indole-3-glycerol phosphate synthase [Natrarchaeobius halalkaliphilus]RQG90198.1 indole-3-glycerol-phosphate synthase [Natrarchaeobius halalkaliphilus]